MNSEGTITLAECIHIYGFSHLSCENFTEDAVSAAYVAGYSALLEKQDRENPKPLTLEELMATPDGEPLYCIHSKLGGGYVIKRTEEEDLNYIPMQDKSGKENFLFIRCYGETWTAYRYKPKERM